MVLRLCILDITTKALLAKGVTKGCLPQVPHRVEALLQGKKLVDPLTKYTSHVPVSLESSILSQLMSMEEPSFRAFWDNPSRDDSNFIDDHGCEELHVKSHYRTEDDRYITYY